MSDDTTARLRRIANFDTPQDPRKACMEAADEIERLRSRLSAARNAAFDEAAKVMDDWVQEAATVGARLSDEGKTEDADRYSHYRRAYGSAAIAIRGLKGKQR